MAPVHEPDAAPGPDGGEGGVDVLGDHVSPVEHAAGHVHAVAGVALDHLVGRPEACVRDFGRGELLAVGSLRGDDGGVGDQDGGYDLADAPAGVGIGGTVDVEAAAADVIDGFPVAHEGTAGASGGIGVGSQDGVVGIHYGRGHLGGRAHREL